jgi:hypothetical protein
LISTSYNQFLLIFDFQLYAEYSATVPEESRISKLRFQWSRIRANVLDAAHKHTRKGRDIAKPLASMDEFDEGFDDGLNNLYLHYSII